MKYEAVGDLNHSTISLAANTMEEKFVFFYEPYYSSYYIFCVNE
jgi:hypothetical protein